jgi:hypothetical protein
VLRCKKIVNFVSFAFFVVHSSVYFSLLFLLQRAENFFPA